MKTSTAEPKTSENRLRSILKLVILAFIIGILVRWFLYQPFHIPSRSMEPNLLKGDTIITSKYAYGYGRHSLNPLRFRAEGRLFGAQPKRGDVVVFKSTRSDGFYIKRLIGLPGDSVQLKGGMVTINGTEQSYSLKDDGIPKGTGALTARLMKEHLLGSEKAHAIADSIYGSNGDNTPVYEVPDGQYFLLGDNRDYSYDSRFSIHEGGIGFIKSADIIGRAEFVLLSAEPGFNVFKPWTWDRIRGERWIKGL